MSGGQKRRLSLAVCILHAPPILILDEPTVGVDPLLSHDIWNYLRTLTDDFGTTIIITTHYIEEASGADVVRIIMRCLWSIQIIKAEFHVQLRESIR